MQLICTLKVPTDTSTSCYLSSTNTHVSTSCCLCSTSTDVLKSCYLYSSRTHISTSCCLSSTSTHISTSCYLYSTSTQASTSYCLSLLRTDVSKSGCLVVFNRTPKGKLRNPHVICDSSNCRDCCSRAVARWAVGVCSKSCRHLQKKKVFKIRSGSPSRQVRLLCSWARHLTGRLRLYVEDRWPSLERDGLRQAS